jgi:conjugal transfer mating pair stabilization protein TraN
VNVTQVINAPLQNNTCTSGVLSGDTCISTQTSDPLEVSSCPSGFNLNADQCVQNVSLPADATPICLNGALWSVQSQSCVQSTQVVSAANQSFGACPSGMIFDVDQCIQSNTQTAQVVGYSCPSNSQLTGTSCSEYEQTTLAPTELLNCSTDEQLINNQCVSSSTSQATALYSCPSGSTLSNQSCSTTISQPQSMQLSCNGVGTLSSYLPPSMPFKCYQFASDFGCQIFAYYLSLSYVNTDTSSGQSVCVYGPVLVLECPSGTEFNGVACLQTTVTEASIAGYECAVGVLSNGVCTVTTSSAALISYVCPAQSQLINNNGEYQCTATTTTITPATPSYSCSPGYQLSGTQCTQTTYTPALINFSCNAPAVLVGQNCVSEMTVVSTALMSYSCPAGFNLSGTACTTQQSTDPLIQWTCPSGFQLQSSSSSSLMQCTKVVTQAALVTLYCSSGQQLVNSSCVQYTAQTNWSDGCAAFEQSAGQPLPALQ